MNRFGFMRDHREAWPVSAMAEALGVSTSGYHGWVDRPTSSRRQQREQLAKAVAQVFQDSHGNYGSRKVAEELTRRQVQACRNTVAKLMRENDLQSQAQKRRRYVVTTDSDHEQPIAANVLDRQFTASRPDQKWVADITYVATQAGWVYAALVMDLYARRIVGWAVREDLSTSLVTDALQDALDRRRPGADLLHHSDRGSQYASDAYRKLLTDHRIRCSMSRRGNCWDNAAMERCMGTYKHEWVKGTIYEGLNDVRTGLFAFAEIYYNRQRIHQAIGYVTPVEHEAAYHQKHAA